MEPVTYHGQTMSIAHLAPFDFACPCPEIGRNLIIRAAFLNHCYTTAFDPMKHERGDIVLYDAPGRARVFDAVRHTLSHGLPQIVAGLPGQRVYQTTATRNYVYAVPMEIAGEVYEVFFQVQRDRKDGRDLRLTVESAYPMVHPVPLPKRPNSIRFNVLVYKVFTGQPVRFAAR